MDYNKENNITCEDFETWWRRNNYPSLMMFYSINFIDFEDKDEPIKSTIEHKRLVVNISNLHSI